MRERTLTATQIGPRGLVYMERVPAASLVVDQAAAGAGVPKRVDVLGSWEDGLHVSDDLREMWDLPEVVGVERR